MFLGIILVIIAIIFSIYHRTEASKIIYAGLILLGAGGVFFVISLATMYDLNDPVGFPLWVENIAIVSLMSIIPVVPAGIIILIIGSVLGQKPGKKQ